MSAELARPVADDEDEQLILHDIERSIKERLEEQSAKLVTFRPRSSGRNLPILITIMGIVLGAVSVQVLGRVFGGAESGYALAVAGQASGGQDSIVAQLMADSQERIDRKEQELAGIINELDSVDFRLAELEERVRGQVDQLRARLEAQAQQLAQAHRERLIAQGVSGAALDQAMRVFTAEQRAGIEAELSEIREQIEGGVRAERNTLLARREELNTTLVATRQEIEQMRQEVEAAAANDPEAIMAALRQQQQTDQLFIGRIDAGYAQFQELLARRDVAGARQQLANLARFLREDPAVERIELLRNRRNTDLTLIQRLNEYLDLLQGAGTVLRPEQEERLGQISAAVQVIQGSGGQGMLAESEQVQRFREAMRAIPELQSAADVIDNAVRQEIAQVLRSAAGSASPSVAGGTAGVPASARASAEQQLADLATALERSAAALPGGIAPLAAQLRSLATQVAQASPAALGAETLQRVQQEVAALQTDLTAVRRRADAAEAESARLRDQLDAAERRYQTAISDVERLRADLARLDRERAAALQAGATDNAAAARADALLAERDGLSNRLREAEARAEALRAETDALRSQLNSVQARAAGAEAEAQRLVGEISAVERRLRDAEDGRTGAETALRALTAEVERLRSSLLRAEATAAEATAALTQESPDRAALLEATQRVRAREAELDQLTEERRILRSRVEALQIEVATLQRRAADLEQRLTTASTATGDQSELVVRYQQFNQRIADLSGRYQAVLTRVNTLLATERPADTQTAYELLLSALADPVAQEIFPRLDSNLRTIDRAVVAYERQQAANEVEIRMLRQLEQANLVAAAEQARLLEAQTAAAPASTADPIRILTDLIAEVDAITTRSFLDQPQLPNPRPVGTVSVADAGDVVLFERASGVEVSLIRGLQFHRRLPSGELVLLGEGEILAAAGSTIVARITRTISPTVRPRLSDIVLGRF